MECMAEAAMEELYVHPISTPLPDQAATPTSSPLPALTSEEKLALLMELGEELKKDPDEKSVLQEQVARMRADWAAGSVPADGEDDVCPADFDGGQQLLPRTAVRYRAPFADFFIFFNSLFFDALSPFFFGGVLKAREVPLVLTREGGGPVLFRPILPPRPATAIEYDGTAWASAMAKYRLFAVLLILLGINVGAWVISLITVALNDAKRNPLNILWAWQFASLSDIIASILEGSPSLLAVAVWSLLASIIFVCFFWLHVSAKAPAARCMGPVGLASVLPLALHARAPIVMISYPWEEGTRDVARSLASVLPNVFIDVQLLVPGSNVPKLTAAVSRWACCLVICLSEGYLKRSACVLEFATACLRRKWYQTTIAFLPTGNGLSDRAKELVMRLGVQVIEDPRLLLEYVNNHVYACSTAEDQQRVAAWYGRVSTMRVTSPRGLRMPAPAILSSNVVRARARKRPFPP